MDYDDRLILNFWDTVLSEEKKEEEEVEKKKPLRKVVGDGHKFKKLVWDEINRQYEYRINGQEEGMLRIVVHK